MPEISNRIAIVTGGAKGIGRAISMRLAQDGVKVSIWDRNEEPARQVVEDIEAKGGVAIATVLDVKNKRSIIEAVARTRQELGPVTILVNNAGMESFMRFQDIEENVLDDLYAANLKGPFFCAQAVVQDMIDAGWGRIVNISSTAAQDGGGGALMTHYAASKSAMIGFTKALAMELAQSGITVNVIPPALIDTPMLRRTPFNLDNAKSRFPVGRIGRPEDVAAACAYLVSDEAGYVTGHTLNVNGGRYLS